MRSSLIQRALVLLAAVCLAASVPVPSSAQQTQSQQQTGDKKQQKKSGGSAKATTKSAPVKADDADKLTPERMSTRGLHKGGKDKSATGNASSTTDSTSKQDSQK